MLATLIPITEPAETATPSAPLTPPVTAACVVRAFARVAMLMPM